ncbi:MAG: hypothetical protein EPN85_04145 [Bacteroidetes bacterium]|nr:MAG: hypothetical protein EPN85_04145 [Bacteroidota bacterium]
MEGIFFIAALLITAVPVYGQDWGIGVRVGDPVGITIKKYTEYDAIELSIGGADLFYGNRLYARNLHTFYNEKTSGYKGFDYVINTPTIPFGFQLNYLIRKELSYTMPAMQWFYGFGGQFRIQKCSYDFHYQIPNNPTWYTSTGDMVTDVDLGGNAVIGMEYTPTILPISLFFDMTLFMEAVDDPFIFWLQGGIGLRYNFGGGMGDRTPLRGAGPE